MPGDEKTRGEEEALPTTPSDQAEPLLPGITPGIQSTEHLAVSTLDPESEPEGIYKLVTGPPDAFVIYCSDSRFQKAFHDFVENLGVERPCPLIVPGSVSSIGAGIRFLLSKPFKTMIDQLRLLLEADTDVEPRIILINHEGCRGYAFLEKRFGRLLMRKVHYRNTLEKQEIDLLAAAGTIRKELIKRVPWLDRARFEMYLARIEGDNIVFDGIYNSEDE